MSTPGFLRLTDELADLDLGDARRNRRACTLIETLGQRPDPSIPAACGSWKETKAAYRLFDADPVTAQKLLEPHYQCTLERMTAHPTVLCIQDTTELDYTGKSDIQGLGSLNYETRRGFYLHPTLAVTPERLPLGILDCWSWTRPLAEGKASIRWLEGSVTPNKPCGNKPSIPGWSIWPTAKRSGSRSTPNTDDNSSAKNKPPTG